MLVQLQNAIPNVVTASAVHSTVLFILYLFMIHTVEAVRVWNLNKVQSFTGIAVSYYCFELEQYMRTESFTVGCFLIQNKGAECDECSGWGSAKHK